MNIRPFDDLIKPIKYDGKTFVPIEEIAKLAVKIKDHKFKNPKIFIGSNFIYSSILVRSTVYKSIYLRIDHDFEIYSACLFDIQAVHNQVQIVKNLIKWGFIEP